MHAKKKIREKKVREEKVRKKKSTQKKYAKKVRAKKSTGIKSPGNPVAHVHTPSGSLPVALSLMCNGTCTIVLL